MDRRHFLILLGGTVVAAGAAAAGVAALPGNKGHSAFPEIAYGEENCSYCGMSIDDPRFASAWRAPDDSERHFDDIGCLVESIREDGPSSGTEFFTHDYSLEAWMDATTATYLVSPEIKTPMSYGVLAVPDREAANELPVYATAQVHDWTALLDQLERIA
jgi:copper chaperone NosL